MQYFSLNNKYRRERELSLVTNRLQSIDRLGSVGCVNVNVEASFSFCTDFLFRLCLRREGSRESGETEWRASHLF